MRSCVDAFRQLVLQTTQPLQTGMSGRADILAPMWCRSIRWSEMGSSSRIRATYMPTPDSGDLDTSALTPDTLADLLPASGSGLYAKGLLLAEFVVEEDDAPDQLRDWLTLLSPIGADSVVDYVMLERPLPTIYHSHVAAGVIQDNASADQRAFETIEFGFERAGSG